MDANIHGLPCPMDPPPAYSVQDPIRRRLNRSYPRSPLSTTLAILERSQCCNPYSLRWPGCCRSCAITLFMDSIMMIAQYVITVISILVMIEGPGWQESPIVTAVCSLMLLCVRTSTIVGKSISLIGRASQTVNLLATVVFNEIYTNGTKTQEKPISWSKYNSIQVLFVCCLALSAASGALSMNYNAECLWTGPDLMWQSSVLFTLCSVAIVLVGIIHSSQRCIKYTLAICAIISMIAAVRDSASAITMTCVYKHHRYRMLRTKRSLGRARCISADDNTQTIHEDDVSCFTSAAKILCDIFAVLILILSIPGIFATHRSLTQKKDRIGCEESTITALFAAIVGSLIIFGMSPEQPNSTDRAFSATKIVSGLVITLGVILTMALSRVGPALFVAGIAMMTALMTLLLRRCSQGIRLLSTACLAKTLLGTLILSCCSIAPISWTVDEYWI